jgi:hypothetical protein
VYYLIWMKCSLLQHRLDIRGKLLIIDDAEMPFYYPATLIDEYRDRHSLRAEVLCQSIVHPDREGNLKGIHYFLYAVDIALDEDADDPDSSVLISEGCLLEFGDFLFALLSPVSCNVNHQRSAAQRAIRDRSTVDGLESEVLDSVFGKDSQRKDTHHKHCHDNFFHKSILLSALVLKLPDGK